MSGYPSNNNGNMHWPQNQQGSTHQPYAQQQPYGQGTTYPSTTSTQGYSNQGMTQQYPPQQQQQYMGYAQQSNNGMNTTGTTQQYAGYDSTQAYQQSQSVQQQVSYNQGYRSQPMNGSTQQYAGYQQQATDVGGYPQASGSMQQSQNTGAYQSNDATQGYPQASMNGSMQQPQNTGAFPQQSNDTAQGYPQASMKGSMQQLTQTTGAYPQQSNDAFVSLVSPLQTTMPPAPVEDDDDDDEFGGFESGNTAWRQQPVVEDDPFSALESVADAALPYATPDLGDAVAPAVIDNDDDFGDFNEATQETSVVEAPQSLGVPQTQPVASSNAALNEGTAINSDTFVGLQGADAPLPGSHAIGVDSTNLSIGLVLPGGDQPVAVDPASGAPDDDDFGDFGGAPQEDAAKNENVAVQNILPVVPSDGLLNGPTEDMDPFAGMVAADAPLPSLESYSNDEQDNVTDVVKGMDLQPGGTDDVPEDQVTVEDDFGDFNDAAHGAPQVTSEQQNSEEGIQTALSETPSSALHDVAVDDDDPFAGMQVADAPLPTIGSYADSLGTRSSDLSIGMGMQSTNYPLDKQIGETSAGAAAGNDVLARSFPEDDVPIETSAFHSQAPIQITSNAEQIVDSIAMTFQHTQTGDVGFLEQENSLQQNVTVGSVVNRDTIVELPEEVYDDSFGDFATPSDVTDKPAISTNSIENAPLQTTEFASTDSITNRETIVELPADVNDDSFGDFATASDDVTDKPVVSTNIVENPLQTTDLASESLFLAHSADLKPDGLDSMNSDVTGHGLDPFGGLPTADVMQQTLPLHDRVLVGEETNEDSFGDFAAAPVTAGSTIESQGFSDESNYVPRNEHEDKLNNVDAMQTYHFEGNPSSARSPPTQCQADELSGQIKDSSGEAAATSATSHTFVGGVTDENDPISQPLDLAVKDVATDVASHVRGTSEDVGAVQEQIGVRESSDSSEAIGSLAFDEQKLQPSIIVESINTKDPFAGIPSPEPSQAADENEAVQRSDDRGIILSTDDSPPQMDSHAPENYSAHSSKQDPQTENDPWTGTLVDDGNLSRSHNVCATGERDEDALGNGFGEFATAAEPGQFSPQTELNEFGESVLAYRNEFPSDNTVPQTGIEAPRKTCVDTEHEKELNDAAIADLDSTAPQNETEAPIALHLHLEQENEPNHAAITNAEDPIDDSFGSFDGAFQASTTDHGSVQLADHEGENGTIVKKFDDPGSIVVSGADDTRNTCESNDMFIAHEDHVNGLSRGDNSSQDATANVIPINTSSVVIADSAVVSTEGSNIALAGDGLDFEAPKKASTELSEVDVPGVHKDEAGGPADVSVTVPAAMSFDSAEFGDFGGADLGTTGHLHPVVHDAAEYEDIGSTNLETATVPTTMPGSSSDFGAFDQTNAVEAVWNAPAGVASAPSHDSADLGDFDQAEPSEIMKQSQPRSLGAAIEASVSHDSSEFGDFGGFEAAEVIEVAPPTQADGAGANETTINASFDDFSQPTMVQLPNAVADKNDDEEVDEFGDFGDFEDSTPIEKAESGAEAATRNDLDEFGSFDKAVPVDDSKSASAVDDAFSARIRSDFGNSFQALPIGKSTRAVPTNDAREITSVTDILSTFETSDNESERPLSSLNYFARVYSKLGRTEPSPPLFLVKRPGTTNGVFR